ncbi:MAG: ABC transporter substrate-binding protein, partial [Kineosporiaceae bacterium]
AGEGALNVLAWPGYAEDGSTDPKVDWVSPFEKASGCQVNVKTFATSNEAVTLFKSGGYDVVSASGDASLRLVYGGLVQPVNTSLVPNYADVIEGLKNQPWNTVGSTNYGVPHGRGANLLLFNKAAYPTPPDSWKNMFDPASPAKGKISPYDDAIYIADAAVYLMSTTPALGIKNPYALDRKQFDAAIELLKQQKPLVAEYWADITKQGTALAAGTVLESQGWQITANLANAGGDKVGTVKPKEGATGWSDTWMIKKGTKNLNCAYKWLDHIASPSVNAQVAEYFGEAPANRKSCALTLNKSHCTEYHAEETGFWTNVWYWTTPTEKCLDGRADATCIGYDEWVKAWSALRA